MTCHCQIIPGDVLEKLSQNNNLSTVERQSLADTAKLDAQIRKFRNQAMKLSQATSLAGIASLAPIAAAPAIAIYDCKHSQTLPGTPVANPTTSPDPTAKKAANETQSLARFYQTVFGRNSIDGNGMTMMSSIHYGSNYNNAFWNGTQMTYGDGDNSIFIDFTKGNDVIAHEITHGVTQHSLQLNYSGDAGGLNESLSDCFGSMFRQWEANQTSAQGDWLIGKDIMGPSAIKLGYTCLRDMADPAAKHCLAPQPTKYSQITPGMDPHQSSGPPNLAFCRACKAASGHSWDKVGKVWYQSMTGFGPSPTMKMPVFANRTRKVASKLFAGDKALYKAIDDAWKSVGL